MAYTVIFAGPEAHEGDQVTVNSAGLTGGSGSSATTTTQGVAPINEVQTYSLGGDYPAENNYATGGTFTLTFDGQTTAPIPYYASPIPYLEALSNIEPGDVTYTGFYYYPSGPNAPRLTFAGQYEGVDVPQVTVDTTDLVIGPGSPSGSSTVAQGTPGVSEVQEINLGGATGGQFQLGFGGYYTAPIASDASAAEVQAALEALPNIAPGDVVVTGGNGTYQLSFGGAYASQNVEQVTVSESGTSGDPPTVETAVAANPVDPGALVPWRIVIKTSALERLGELANYRLNRVDNQLGNYGAFDFDIGVHEPSAALVRAVGREVEIWHGTNVAFAGPMVRVKADGQARMNVQGADPSWYFKHRHIGKAGRTNYLLNPIFTETPVGSWPGRWGEGGATATVRDGNRILGPNTVELVQATVDVDTHIHQQIYFNTDALGLYVTLVAHFFIEEWIGSTFEERGLFIEVRDASNQWTHYEFLRINEETPRGVWVRGEVGIHLPPSVTGYSVDARLYAIAGRIRWGATSMTVMESLSFYNVDQATIADAIVAHVQDPAYDKSDLLIGRNCPPTGIKRTVHHQHADHLGSLDALNQLVNVRDGLEWDVQIAPNQRTFTTYYPRKTNDRSGTVLAVGPNPDTAFGTIVDFTVEVDGEDTANVIIVLGEQEGPDREEGSAEDPTALDGLTLEKVIFPPAGANIDRLDALADAALARTKNPVTIVGVTIHAPHLLHSLKTGDVVSVVINCGWVQVNDRYRIVATSIDPQNETMDLTLNEAEMYGT